jgi:pyridoxamine 5'-phosphate oxidase
MGYGSCMSTDSPPNDLNLILPLCWHLLARGAQERKFGFHHPVVATVGAAGLPKSRVVILREADAARKILRFNADIRTQKWGELTAQPAISLAFYDELEKTQLRVEGRAVLYTQNETAKLAWDASQRMSRIGYGAEPGPGAAIDDPTQFTMPETDDAIALAFVHFGTVEIAVHSIEWLYLKVRGNRRAFFDLDAASAQWLVP